MSEPMTRRDFLKNAGWAAFFATGASLLSPFFKGTPKVEGVADAGDLSHKAKILETDNNLGVENAVAQFQIVVEGKALSTFALTEKDEYGRPRIFTNNGDIVARLDIYKNSGESSWYIPGNEANGPDGVEILAYKDVADADGSRTVHYFPPYGGMAEQVRFDREKDAGYVFSSSELPQKVQALLFT